MRIIAKYNRSRQQWSIKVPGERGILFYTPTLCLTNVFVGTVNSRPKLEGTLRTGWEPELKTLEEKNRLAFSDELHFHVGETSVTRVGMLVARGEFEIFVRTLNPALPSRRRMRAEANNPKMKFNHLTHEFMPRRANRANTRAGQTDWDAFTASPPPPRRRTTRNETRTVGRVGTVGYAIPADTHLPVQEPIREATVEESPGPAWHRRTSLDNAGNETHWYARDPVAEVVPEPPTTRDVGLDVSVAQLEQVEQALNQGQLAYTQWTAAYQSLSRSNPANWIRNSWGPRPSDLTNRPEGVE